MHRLLGYVKYDSDPLNLSSQAIDKRMLDVNIFIFSYRDEALKAFGCEQGLSSLKIRIVHLSQMVT